LAAAVARPPSQTPESVQITWALVVSGHPVHPGNLYPVFTIVSFGHQNSSTILGACGSFDRCGWPLAVIIFVASIVVPLIKRWAGLAADLGPLSATAIPAREHQAAPVIESIGRCRDRRVRRGLLSASSCSTIWRLSVPVGRTRRSLCF